MPSITHPRQVVLITSRARIDFRGKEIYKDNVAATTFDMPCSLNPKSYCISLPKTSHTSKLINLSKVFVVNFVLDNMKEEVEACVKHSGEHLDKFEQAKIEKEEAEKVDCPRLKGSAGYLECEVINELEVGDHMLFIGKVVNSMLNSPGKRLFLKETGKYTTTVE